MSSSKTKDQSIEEIEEGKPVKETERCGTGRASRLPTHARSPSVSGQKSKIPTNVGHAGRPIAVTQSQVQDNFRLLTSVVSDETAIGNASPINSGRFPTSKSLTTASSQPAASNISKANKSLVVSIGHSAMLKRHLEAQFSTKRKRYVSLKKELTDKQKNAVDLYEEMSQLREKLIASGAKDPGKIEMINLTGISSQSCAIHSPIEPHILRGDGEHVFAQNSSVTSDLISSIETQIREIPKRYDEHCEGALKKQSEILQLLVKFESSEGENAIDPEICKQIETFKNQNSDLSTRVEETKKSDEIVTSEIIEKISILWNEVEVSRERICELENISDEMTRELSVKLDASLTEKKTIEEKFEQLRERKVTLETELQKSRVKIRGMETRISEDETKVSQLQSNVKNLETQLKQKESGAEQRLKEMQKSLKNSESLLTKMEKQRDSFESRVNELKKNFSAKENEAEKRTRELSEKLHAVNAELAKERGENSQTRSEGTKVEGNFDRTTFENRLAERDEKILTLQREKQEIIRVINPGLLNDGSSLKFDEGENSHEKIIAALTKKMQDLRLNFKLTQERNDSLQRQLTEFRTRSQAQSKDSDKSFWSDRVMELEKQVYELRCSVAELTRRNEDLEIALNQKRLELEEQDRVMRENNNVLKVRDEVIGLIKGRPESRGKSGEAAGHLSLVKKKNNQRDREQVDKQIAEKTENLQQLYSTLETKQMQITRLEQLVQQMEIQQERAQEQRTRLEKKIAQLQLAMHYKKRHRYVAPESPKVSSAKVSSPTFRESSENEQRSLYDRALQNSFSHPRSSSRPSKLPRSPLRHQHQPMQRSKTLNSFYSKSRPSSSKIYASRVMDEVARALKHERDYDYEKRALARDEIASRYSRQDRGSEFIVNNDVLDDLEISKDDIHESFYNWLVEPWMFEGSRIEDNCQNDWTRANRSANSTGSFQVRTYERSPSRAVQRATNDCSRKSRCDSPECRRCSLTEWNCSSELTTRARTSPQDAKQTRSRRQKS